MDYVRRLSERDKERLTTLLFWTILLTGLILRTYQYLMGRSLWEDEAHLALTFIYNGYSRLLSPLDHFQVAPVLFLYGVKTFTKLFGFGELALRALPFLASIFTLPLFYYVVIELTASRLTALMGFFIFSLNLTAVSFAGELKPYALDLSCVLLLLYLTLSKNIYVQPKRDLLMKLAGIFALLISNTSFVILLCIAINLMVGWMHDKKIKQSELKMIVAWGLVYLANYFIFVHNHSIGGMQNERCDFVFSPAGFLNSDFAKLLYLPGSAILSYLLFIILVVGVGQLLLKKKYLVLCYSGLPILVHFLLSSQCLFLSSQGFPLYLLPCFIILIAVGLHLIISFVSARVHIFAGVLIGLFLCFGFVKGSLSKFPQWAHEVKPAIQFVNQYRPLSTSVYVFDPANTYKYYIIMGQVQKPIVNEIPETIEPADFYKLVNPEYSKYLLFSSDAEQPGYKRVLNDLKQKGLVVETFANNSYVVNVVKADPAQLHPVHKEFNYKNFDSAVTFKEDMTVVIWSREITSEPQTLQKGNYEVSVISRGTPVKGVYPHHQVYINDNMIGEFSNTADFKRTIFYFEQPCDTGVRVRIVMDNDLVEGREDINSFIKTVEIKTAE